MDSSPNSKPLNKTLMQTLTVMLMVVCCGTISFGQAIEWETDIAKASKTALDTKRLVWLHFEADWCVPCQRLDTFVFSSTGVIRAVDQNVVAVKVDVDEADQLVKKMGVHRVPHDIVMTPAGRVIVSRPSPKSTSGYRKFFSDLDRPLQQLNSGNRDAINFGIDQIQRIARGTSAPLVETSGNGLATEAPQHKMAPETVEGQRLARGFESAKRAAEFRSKQAAEMKQKAELFIASEERKTQAPRFAENPFFSDKTAAATPAFKQPLMLKRDVDSATKNTQEFTPLDGKTTAESVAAEKSSLKPNLFFNDAPKNQVSTTSGVENEDRDFLPPLPPKFDSLTSAAGKSATPTKPMLNANLFDGRSVPKPSFTNPKPARQSLDAAATMLKDKAAAKFDLGKETIVDSNANEFLPMAMPQVAAASDKETTNRPSVDSKVVEAPVQFEAKRSIESQAKPVADKPVGFSPAKQEDNSFDASMFAVEGVTESNDESKRATTPAFDQPKVVADKPGWPQSLATTPVQRKVEAAPAETKPVQKAVTAPVKAPVEKLATRPEPRVVHGLVKPMETQQKQTLKQFAVEGQLVAKPKAKLETTSNPRSTPRTRVENTVEGTIDRSSRPVRPSVKSISRYPQKQSVEPPAERFGLAPMASRKQLSSPEFSRALQILSNEDRMHSKLEAAKKVVTAPHQAAIVLPNADRKVGKASEPTTERGVDRRSDFALKGKCPVTLLTESRWVDGQPDVGCVHRNRVYLFASVKHRDVFQKNPDKFSPLLAGYDPVTYERTKRLVDGNEKHGVFMGKSPNMRVVLFENAENREIFQTTPGRFLNLIRQAMTDTAPKATKLR